VSRALVEYFNAGAVTRGNKAFQVHANTYRIDADVVACFEHIRYFRRSDGGIGKHRGTELHPDNGGRVINWPRQNYANGVRKNEATHKRFKAVVRIMKHLRNEMNEQRIAAALPIPSYLNECLVWNVPNDGFAHNSYAGDIQYNIAHLWNNTRDDDSCAEWGEINELKYLFRDSQPWTRIEVNTFLQAAWDYIGFK
jgi:hypothetical protein